MNETPNRSFDVIVVGGGNAALSAALSAHDEGARVLILDASTKEERGGNSRFAGAIFRIAHDGMESIEPLLDQASLTRLEQVRLRPYTGKDYRHDLDTMSQGRADSLEAQVVIDQGLDIAHWLKGKGVQWELNVGKYFPGDVAGDDRLDLMPGACLRASNEGVGLMASLWAAVERAGIAVRYDSPVCDLIMTGDTVHGVTVRLQDLFEEYYGQVVLACGGFEANPEMRRRYLGTGWDLVKVRGTRFNTGVMLETALAKGARPVGHWGGCHSSPQDYHAPEVGDLGTHNQMSRYSYPFSVMVNSLGQRFVDEGEDSFQYTYAKMGAEIRRQPGALAYQIFDQKTVGLLEPRYRVSRPVVADTLADLAAGIGLEPSVLEGTIGAFNAACAANGAFDPFHNDGLATTGISPPKSNWALPIDKPPFVAHPVTCGITFTYGGEATDLSARVLNREGRPMPGLYAAGEMVGGLFFHNYPGGAGLPRGAIFGRTAGQESARRAILAKSPATSD